MYKRERENERKHFFSSNLYLKKKEEEFKKAYNLKYSLRLIFKIILFTKKKNKNAYITKEMKAFERVASFFKFLYLFTSRNFVEYFLNTFLLFYY